MKIILEDMWNQDIIFLIYQILGSAGPVQQKIKLPSPYGKLF